MAAGLVGSLRVMNGALENAVAQLRSTVSHWRKAPTPPPITPGDADETLNGSVDATVVMAAQAASARSATSTRPQARRTCASRDRFVPVARPARNTAARSSPRPVAALDERIQDERIQDERVQVESRQLSPTIQRWIAAYTEHGTRDLYLWKWCSLGLELTTLPSVAARLRSHLRDTKLLSIMVNVLLDDIADRRQPGPLLAALMNLMRGAAADVSQLSADDRCYVEFTAQIWDEYWSRAREYACFAAYERLLAYDLNQLFNAIQYSSLLNQQLGLLNVVEHDLYSPHNMMMMSFATLDLMASPQFQATELGKLREAIWHAQWMGRIGNLLSTWQREAAVGDFTSGVFARAVALGELTVDQLQTADRSVIESSINYGEHQEFYQRRWNYHRKCFQARAGEIRSLDMTELMTGHDRFLRMHLGSRGLI